MIKGSIVAIVTPMHEDGSLDLPRYRQLIDWHVASGTAASDATKAGTVVVRDVTSPPRKADHAAALVGGAVASTASF